MRRRPPATEAGSAARPGRPTDRVDGAAAAVRARIIERLQPGDRLPSRRELQQELGLALATVQSAFDRLAAEGFIQANGRDGTFVAARPPHLHRILIAFPFTPQDAAWTGMWSAFAAAVAAHPGSAYDLAVLQGYESHPEQRQLLAEEVACRRLAGLVFASDPWTLFGHPAVAEAGLARAAIAPESRAGIPAIALGGDWLARAIDRLATRGARRPALITTPGQAGWSEAAWRRGLAMRGLAHDEQLLQVVAHHDARWIANLVRLLLRLPAGQRPDALAVADDNLATGVFAALAGGPRLPLVMHGNFPLAQADPLPADRLGYDLDSALAACLATVDRQRHGHGISDRTIIPLRFADEAPR